MFNACLLQLGTYNLLYGQTTNIPSNLVLNGGCEIQYSNQQHEQRKIVCQSEITKHFIGLKF